MQVWGGRSAAVGCDCFRLGCLCDGSHQRDDFLAQDRIGNLQEGPIERNALL